MARIELNKEDFLGVWENVNIVPFLYDDNIEITFFLAPSFNTNIEILKNGKLYSYFSENLEIINLENDQFILKFINSDLNNGLDLNLECKMNFTSRQKAFVANFIDYGKRYFELK